jgi:hypothetical protein
MMDWLKATAAAFMAVSVLVGIFIGLLYGPLAFLVRDPDKIQDYRSPDGEYVATVRTESSGSSTLRHHSSVLVHRASIPTQQAINMGKAYVVLGGDCGATVRWDSARVLDIEISSGSSYRGTYEIAPTDLSQQVVIHFEM